MDKTHDFTCSPVPEGQGPRFKWLYLTNIENAVTICIPIFLLGSMLGTSLAPLDLLWVLGFSMICLSVLSGWTSFIGTKTRLSTALLVQNAFGEQGAKIVWFLVGLSLFGWFGVQTEVFSKVLVTLIERNYPQIHPNPIWVTLGCGLLMSTTAILGIRAVGRLAQIAMPFLLLTVFYALYQAVDVHGFTPWWEIPHHSTMPMGTAIASILGAYSVGIIVMPDIKRFAKNETHSVVSGVLGIGVTYPLLLLITAMTTGLIAQPDYLVLLGHLGFGPYLLIILLLATWTTNNINLYSASLNLTPLYRNLSREAITAIAGIFGTALAILGVFESMIPLFMLLGVLTTPLLAVYSVDFLAGQDRQIAPAKPYRKRAFLVWGVASFLGLCTMPTEMFGLGLFEMTTISGIDSMMFAVLMSVLLHISDLGRDT